MACGPGAPTAAGGIAATCDGAEAAGRGAEATGAELSPNPNPPQPASAGAVSAAITINLALIAHLSPLISCTSL